MFVIRPTSACLKLNAVLVDSPHAMAAVKQRLERLDDAHLDQGRQVVAGRKDGSSRGEEYANADLAMQEADAKERLKRFFGK